MRRVVKQWWVEDDPATGVRREARDQALQYALRWPVHEYEIVTTPLRGGLRALQAYTGTPWPAGGVFVPKGWPAESEEVLPLREYEPVADAEEIFQDATRLAMDDAEALLAFVNTWGLLGVGVPPARSEAPALPQRIVSWAKGGAEAIRAIQDGRADGIWLPTGTDADGRRTEMLYGPVRRRPAPQGLTGLDGVEQVRGSLKWVQDRAKELQALQHGRATAATWADLAWDLNAVLGNITPGVAVTRRRPRPVWRVARLLDVLVLRLWELATGADRLRRCPECGALFTPDRKDQRYCKTRGSQMCARRVATRQWRRRGGGT